MSEQAQSEEARRARVRQVRARAQRAMERKIDELSRKGWLIVSQTDRAVQMRKPRQWSKVLLILSLLTIPLGIGLLLLLVTVIDYLFRSEQHIYFTDLQALSGEVEITSPRRQFWIVVGIGLLMLAAFMSFILVILPAILSLL